MEHLQRVLEERSGDITAHVVRRQGFSPETAGRFVQEAGPDLLESWRWQASSLQVEDLATWSNVQRLLGGMHANALARALGMPPAEVWQALRVFVPKVLLLARRSTLSVAPQSPLRRRRPPRREGAGFGERASSA